MVRLINRKQNVLHTFWHGQGTFLKQLRDVANERNSWKMQWKRNSKFINYINNVMVTL